MIGNFKQQLSKRLAKLFPILWSVNFCLCYNYDQFYGKYVTITAVYGYVLRSRK